MTSIKDDAAKTAEGPEEAHAATPRTAGPQPPDQDGKLTLAEILEMLAGGRLPLRFTAYDGSSAGPPDAPLGIELTSPRGTTYLATARGDLGLARAYIAGDLEIHGVHPGDPYELLKALADPARLRLLSLIQSATDGEACVCDLTAPLGLSQPTVSHHLRILTEADLLEREKRGVWAYYRLVPSAIATSADLLTPPRKRATKKAR